TQPFLEAGTYSVVVTSPGYIANTTNVTLTPGNTSAVIVHLDQVPASSGGSSPSDQWLGGDGLVKLSVIAMIAVAVIIGGAILLSRKGKGTRPPRSGTSSPPNDA
ncbi:MAG TPA: PEGA domain-containing protein, partial [Thermoplasmata archaeon]